MEYNQAQTIHNLTWLKQEMAPATPPSEYLVDKFNIVTTSGNMSYLDDIDTDFACISILPNNIQVHISHIIFIFCSFIFVLTGFIGNLISIVVFSSKNMRTVSSNVYLWVLSVSDTCYLLTVLFSKVLPTLRCIYFPDSTFDIINRNNVLCKLLQYFLDLFSDYSTILILAFTVERYFACYHVVWFREFCTVRRARILCFVIFAGIVILIAPYHALYIGLYKQYNVCTVLVDFEKKFTILYILEALVFRIIPVFIIAVLNFLIIIKVTELSRQRTRRRSSAVLTTSKGGYGPAVSKEDRHIQLTTLLLLVSSSYVVLYFPVLIHFLIWWLHRNQTLVIAESTLILTQNYARILYIMGFAINFFLYTLSGRVFRDQLRCIACGLHKTYTEINNMTLENDNPTNMTHVNTSPRTRNTNV